MACRWDDKEPPPKNRPDKNNYKNYCRLIFEPEKGASLTNIAESNLIKPTFSIGLKQRAYMPRWKFNLVCIVGADTAYCE